MYESLSSVKSCASVIFVVKRTSWGLEPSSWMSSPTFGSNYWAKSECLTWELTLSQTLLFHQTCDKHSTHAIGNEHNQMNIMTRYTLMHFEKLKFDFRSSIDLKNLRKTIKVDLSIKCFIFFIIVEDVIANLAEYPKIFITSTMNWVTDPWTKYCY